jgi:ferredoxin
MKKGRVYPGFVSEIKRFGRFDFTGCYNCGTCPAVCALSSDSAPFPRRPIQLAIMGLREEILKSLEPWLCHDCGDCSKWCPRENEPQHSMGTLRRFLLAQYDWTGIASRIMRSKVFHFISLFLTSLLFLLLVWVYHMFIDPDVKGTMSTKEFLSTPMDLSHMFAPPHPVMWYFTLFAILFPILMVGINVLRMWKWTMSDLKVPFSIYVKELLTYVRHSVTHENIRKCEETKTRWTPHWLMAFGCVLMLVILVFALPWFQTDKVHPLYHPQRWLGYIATIFMLYGSGDVLLSRIRKKSIVHKYSEFSDITFPLLLFLVSLSGIVLHILRIAGLSLATHYAYAVHIAITLPMLLIELPFGKWSHMIYRPMAIYFQRVKESFMEKQQMREAA